MNKLLISPLAIGVISVLFWCLLGTVPTSQAAAPAATFQATDEPGPWFRCAKGSGCVAAGTQSLAVVSPGSVIKFIMASQTETVHTTTS